VRFGDRSSSTLELLGKTAFTPNAAISFVREARHAQTRLRKTIRAKREGHPRQMIVLNCDVIPPRHQFGGAAQHNELHSDRKRNGR
jgi:hypothetical protein